jgi:hypothetical protein
VFFVFSCFKSRVFRKLCRRRVLAFVNRNKVLLCDDLRCRRHTTSNADSANQIWVVKWSDCVTANGLARGRSRAARYAAS